MASFIGFNALDALAIIGSYACLLWYVKRCDFFRAPDVTLESNAHSGKGGGHTDAPALGPTVAYPFHAAEVAND